MKLHIPTDETPFQYDKDFIFYKDHLIIDGLRLNYDELTIIMFEGESKYVNGAKVTDNGQAHFYFSKSEKVFIDFEDNDLGYFTMNYKKGLLPINNSLIKKFHFIVEFLKERTFEKRYERYKYFLKRDGYYNIENNYFYNNGDIIVNNVFQGNIHKAFKQNKLISGTSFGSYKNKIQDPYYFGIKKGTKLFGLIHDIYTFRNIVNKDIFDILVLNCLKSGFMVS